MPTDSEPETEAHAGPGSATSPTDSPKSTLSKPGMMSKLGIGLMLLSGVFFFMMLTVPWWPLSGAVRTLIGGILFVGVQVSWWVGAALAGQAVVRSMFSWIRRK